MLVQHPKTRFVAFTGSRDVGLRINELAAKTPAGPDLDQARHRRDGRQGRHHRGRRVRSRQGRRGRGRIGLRLSGAEVLGVLARHRGREGVRRVPRKAADESRRPAGRRRRRSGQLHGAGDQRRQRRRSILNYIEVGKKEGRLIAGGDAADGGGYLVQPTGHAAHGADDRRPLFSRRRSATCTTTTSRRIPPVRRASCEVRSGVRSVTAHLSEKALLPIDPAQGRVPLHDPSRIRDHVVQQLDLHGEGLRIIARRRSRPEYRCGEASTSGESRWA